MMHIWDDMTTMPSRITNHLFQRIPRNGFDVWLNGVPIEDAPENILNPFTVWAQLPLFGDMVKRFVKKFILNPGFVTEDVALLYLDHHHLSPEQISGTLNLIMYTAFPRWEADLVANAP